MSERRALIIANFDYQDPALHRLASPAEDAKELGDVLGSPAVGSFEVETLVNQTAARVSEAIEEFFVFSSPKPDDLLLFYFSGHGVTDEEGKLYFAATDTQFVRHRIRRASAVSADFVDGVMRRSRSRRQILVLDCCHGGAFAEGMSLKGPLPGLETHFQGRGRVVLTASTGVQFSLEGLGEDGVQQPSVYTRILVKGLRTGDADRDGDGWVSLDELHDYLLDGVHAEAPQQTPTKSGYLEGQLYIARALGARPAALPRTLQNALQDPDVLTRRGAVSELGELLLGEHPGLALAARQALEIRRDTDDSFKIRRAAANYLAMHEAQGTPTATGVTVERPSPTIEPERQGLAIPDGKKTVAGPFSMEMSVVERETPKKSAPSEGLDATNQRKQLGKEMASQEMVRGQRKESKATSDIPAPVLPEGAEGLEVSAAEPQPPPPVSVPQDSGAGTLALPASGGAHAGRFLSSPRARLVIGAVSAGFALGAVDFASWNLGRWFHVDLIFWWTPCVVGLALALVLRRFTTALRRKHVALICLVWLLVTLLVEKIPAALGIGTGHPVEWIRRYYLAISVPESALEGAFTGLILAWALDRKRWGGVSAGTLSLVIGALSWLILTWWIEAPSPTVYALASVVQYTLVAGSLVWYIGTYKTE